MSRQLSNKLTNALLQKKCQKKEWFLPHGIIDQLITKKSILKAIGQKRGIQTSPENESLAEHILEHAQKIFAISVTIGVFDDRRLRLAMQQIKEFGVSDQHLPTDQKFWEEKGFICPQAADSQDSDNSEDESCDEGNPWKSSDVTSFCIRQWAFLVPVFALGEFYDGLQPESILPFMDTVHDKKHRVGAFGQVTGYEIHPSHLVARNGTNFVCPKVVAVKKIIDNGNDGYDSNKSWENEASILKRMNELNQRHIVQFYTAFRAGDPGCVDHYVMLEWADGGNLKNLWKDYDRPALTANLVKTTVHQLLGLAEALKAAHDPQWTPSSSAANERLNFRHGDLKPENILWFKKEGEDDGIGLLKICDWGLAKKHEMVTELRSRGTTTRWGTRMYEPPEEAINQGQSLQLPGQPGKKKSRLYDIWSMGCIMLEFLIWLAYGNEELERFQDNLQRDNTRDSGHFYKIDSTAGNKAVPELHPVAAKWMDHMAQDANFAPESSALGKLLDIVRNDLLVVKLPENSETSPHTRDNVESASEENSDIKTGVSSATNSSLESETLKHSPDIGIPTIEVEVVETRAKEVFGPGRRSEFQRATSSHFHTRMLNMSDDGGDESYWFAGLPNPPHGPGFNERAKASQNIEMYQKEDSRMSLTSKGKAKEALQAGLPLASGLAAPRTQKIDYGRTELGNNWDLRLDNEFATRSFSKALLSPSVPTSVKLCVKCIDIRENLFRPAFSITYDTEYLRISAINACDLCRLLWSVCKSRETVRRPEITFTRVGSSFHANGEGPSILSINRSPGSTTMSNQYIQVGYPGLFDTESDEYFEIIKQWLDSCDSSHSACCRTAPNSTSSRSTPQPLPVNVPLPTRVIEVGKPGDKTVSLLETGAKNHGEWVALSHQWGSGQQFCTTVKNLEDHLTSMDVESLPATFRDAITVTRALQRPYLWIDSLCIIQGPDGDFNEQAKKMEQVYSGAYCVLASSRSPGHYAGFLQKRNLRDTVVLQPTGQSPHIYISNTVDDFNGHVLNGSLNTRGWVLQEHALARRTVYFTDHQTYFECGDGVRCETLTKMTNELSAFLGDPNFPHIILTADQGERILRCQDLYTRYSRLGLSKAHDRTMAIDGLQYRILNALDVEGGYGIFDEGNKGSRSRRGLLRRSLLWHRGDDITNLARIDFPKDHPIAKVPSWSWMACSGGIDYISLPFGGVDWEDLRSPWSGGMAGVHQDAMTDKQGGNITLIAEARDYRAILLQDEEGEIVLDRPGGSHQPATKCVILGRQKGSALLKDKLHYFLVVAAMNKRDRNGYLVYERVGAGYMPGKYIEEQKETVRIQ